MASLSRISIELTHAETVDTLCYQAVQLAHQTLGYDRVGIWFIEDEPNAFRGAYGTDEQGNIRDEREMRMVVEAGTQYYDKLLALYKNYDPLKPVTIHDSEIVIHDLHGNAIGSGDYVTAIVWDGEKAIGHINMDNFLTGQPVTNYDCDILGLFALTFGRIYRLKSIEGALQRTEEQYRSIVEGQTDLICRFGQDGTILFANRAFCRYRDVAPQSITEHNYLDWLHPDDRQSVQTALEGLTAENPSAVLEHRVQSADGEPRWHNVVYRVLLSHQGSITGYQSVARDITARKNEEAQRLKLEEQLRAAHKLESLGVLAGGIAHDFNNLLMGILGNASLALMDLSEDSPTYECITDIHTAATRAAELANQMLVYSGRGSFTNKRVDLTALVREMSQLLAASISKRATLRYDFAPDLPPMEGDPTQLRQVVMNLITNASDAMGSHSGVVHIHTIARRLDAKDMVTSIVNSELEPFDAICLEVSDDGCGMSEEVLEKIFDPFYTTKFTGRGLGLAATLGIVRGHRGTIHVRSVPGHGTAFTLCFPAATALGEADVEETPADEAPRVHGKCVLVVDDEEAVRVVAKRALERHGFKVVLANDGREALDLYAAAPDEFDVVVLDMNMPRLDGPQTCRALKGLNHDVKVILSSGYTEQMAVEHAANSSFTDFIHKPYSPKLLVEIISRALGEE